MGIVASEPKIKFKEPEDRSISFDQNSNFSYQMHSFEIEYAVKFDSDEKKRTRRKSEQRTNLATRHSSERSFSKVSLCL
jgi:hypothetical protein